MTERVFLDTNILAYAEDADAGAKRKKARAAIAKSVRERTAVLSTQILQEYFVIATKKLGLSPEEARKRVVTYSKLDVVVVRPEMILAAIDLHRLHSLSFWDALVIRAASSSGCGRILTEDLNDGQVIDGVRIENPL